MAIVYMWTFPQFDVVPSEGELSDVVKTIHWTYSALDGAYQASTYGLVELPIPSPPDFIPYANLTEEWAINVVSKSVNVSEMKQKLAAIIAEQKNPPILPMAPPFAQSEGI